MDYPIQISDFKFLEDKETPIFLAVGVFDGVHIGHLAVIETAVLQAKLSGARAAVLTFDPHPSRLFKASEGTDLIMNLGMKTKHLFALGVDVVIAKSFEREFASIPAESFLTFLREQLPSIKGICVGENFRFGNKRLGDVDILLDSGNRLGVDVWSLDRVKQNGLAISSTRIREALIAGSIDRVNALLGYNYYTEGIVQSGQKLGREIGFPTMNIAWNPECKPKYGVYAVRFKNASSGQWLQGIANYGIRPTIETKKNTLPVLEVHSLERDSLNCGDCIQVEWLTFIRPEEKFNNLSELEAQIRSDCTRVSQFFKDGKQGN